MAAKRLSMGVLVLALAASAAEAAPAAGVITSRSEASGETSMVTQASQRCWRRDGQLRCERRVARVRPEAQRVPTPEYYEHDANRLPYGSARWWEQMMRENRAGQCCN